jgi:hypothetical protein
MTRHHAVNDDSMDDDTEEVGETAAQVLRQLAELGWTREAQDRLTKAERFRRPGGQTLMVRAHNEFAALHAVWRQLNQQPSASILHPEPS